MVEQGIEDNLIACRALHEQRAGTVVGEQCSYAVLPPQLLTVHGFVVTAIVGVDGAIATSGQFSQ